MEAGRRKVAENYMIETPKASEVQKREDLSPHDGDKANDADTHAMGALLNRKDSAGELSSLFSSQTKQACTGSKSKIGTDDLEERLRRYQEDKEEYKEGENCQGEETDRCEDELAREVAERILVSSKEYMDPGSGNEVRIKIKNSILTDAHIHIIREPDCLQVKLISSDEQSIQTLIAARDSLEKQLGENYKGLIRITIVHLSAKGEVRNGKNEYQ